MDFDETLEGWSTHGPLQVLLFFGQIRQQVDPGRVKTNWGILLQSTSSSDRKDTAIDRMHSNDLEKCEKKCVVFGSISKSNIFGVFLAFLYFYSSKCFICIYFV